MRIKRYLSNHAVRTYYHFKGMGILFWIPLFVVNLLLPVLYISIYNLSGAEETLRDAMRMLNQALLPMFSAWWPMFVLREYIESDGNELLYVNRNRSKLPDILLIVVLYMLNVSMWYILYVQWFPQISLELLQILCVCVMYTGMVYCLLYMFASITAAMVSVLLYTFISLSNGSGAAFPLFYGLADPTWDSFKSIYLPLLGIGIGMYIIGALLNAYKIKFV